MFYAVTKYRMCAQPDTKNTPPATYRYPQPDAPTVLAEEHRNIKGDKKQAGSQSEKPFPAMGTIVFHPWPLTVYQTRIRLQPVSLHVTKLWTSAARACDCVGTCTPCTA